MTWAEYSNILSGKTCLLKAFNSLDTGLGAGIQLCRVLGKRRSFPRSKIQSKFVLQLKEKCGTCIYDDKYGDTRSPVPEICGFGVVGNGNRKFQASPAVIKVKYSCEVFDLHKCSDLTKM